MKPIIYPYKQGLNSTALLRDAGCRVRYPTSRVRQGVAVAWGMQTPPPWATNVLWINHPSAIHLVSDKLSFAGLGLGPESTVDRSVAEHWANERGAKVLCRTVLNGSGGAGIVVARNKDQIVDAPLYTKYFKKQREYRVVFSPLCDEPIYVASKRLQADTELDRDALLIRTKDMGFVYQTETDPLPAAVLQAVQEAASVLSRRNLDLLGYDVAYNSDDDTALVIEANSAFGLNPYSAELVVSALETITEKLV